MRGEGVELELRTATVTHKLVRNRLSYIVDGDIRLGLTTTASPSWPEAESSFVLSFASAASLNDIAERVNSDRLL